jgi:hypothetical protein
MYDYDDGGGDDDDDDEWNHFISPQIYNTQRLLELTKYKLYLKVFNTTKKTVFREQLSAESNVKPLI